MLLLFRRYSSHCHRSLVNLFIVLSHPLVLLSLLGHSWRMIRLHGIILFTRHLLLAASTLTLILLVIIYCAVYQPAHRMISLKQLLNETQIGSLGNRSLTLIWEMFRIKCYLIHLSSWSSSIHPPGGTAISLWWLASITMMACIELSRIDSSTCITLIHLMSYSSVHSSGSMHVNLTRTSHLKLQELLKKLLNLFTHLNALEQMFPPPPSLLTTVLDHSPHPSLTSSLTLGFFLRSTLLCNLSSRMISTHLCTCWTTHRDHLNLYSVHLLTEWSTCLLPEPLLLIQWSRRHLIYSNVSSGPTLIVILAIYSCKRGLISLKQEILLRSPFLTRSDGNRRINGIHCHLWHSTMISCPLLHHRHRHHHQPLRPISLKWTLTAFA